MFFFAADKIPVGKLREIPIALPVSTLKHRRLLVR